MTPNPEETAPLLSSGRFSDIEGRRCIVSSQEIPIEVVNEPTTRGCWRPKKYQILTIVGFVTSVLDYFIRNSINIAIISMTKVPKKNAKTHDDNVCPTTHNQTSNDVFFHTYGPVYDWTASEIGWILGTFFWGYFISKAIGGRIGERFGQRRTILISLSMCTFFSSLIPLLAHVSPYCVATLRLLMGLSQGPLFPSMHSLIARWSPPGRLGMISSIVYSGATAGSVMSLVVPSYIVHHLSWEWLFYIEGILILVWIPIWLYFIRDHPSEHPTITAAELSMLQKNVPVKNAVKAPWKAIFSYKLLYIFILAEFAKNWVEAIFNTEGPSFLKRQVGVSLYTASFVCAGGAISSWMFTLVTGYIADVLVRRKILRKVNSRRLMHGIGTFGVAGLLAIVPAVGCNSTVISALWICMIILNTTTNLSFTLSIIDVAPSYAGTLVGLAGIGNIGGFIGPTLISSAFTSVHGWSKVFYPGTGLAVLSGIMYITFTTDKRADWDQPQTDDETNHNYGSVSYHEPLLNNSSTYQGI